MTELFKYTILNPIADKTRPFINKGVFYIPITEKYNYFLEVYQDNPFGGKDYFIILSKTKFNSSCRRCSSDNYSRIKLRLRGEIKDYVFDKCEQDGNIDVEYVESTDEYDVFSIV